MLKNIYFRQTGDTTVEFYIIYKIIWLVLTQYIVYKLLEWLNKSAQLLQFIFSVFIINSIINY